MSGGLSDDDLAQIAAELEDELEDELVPPGVQPAPTYGDVYQSAAMVSSFDLGAIAPQGTTDEEISDVLGDSSPIMQADGSLRWVLSPEVRAEVVRQVADAGGSLPLVLGSAPDVPDDPVQRMITAYATGRAPDLDEQAPEQLAASIRVAQWFGPLLPDAPTETAVAGRLEYVGLVQPFHDLVGDNFQGRKRELDRLSDYVGVRRATSLKERATRLVRRVRNFKERPPMMVYGPGGIGKSTLVAKFIVDHTSSGDRRIPFIYIDFDRPLMDMREPLVVLYDGLRQLGLQYHEARETLLSLRRAWEDRFRQAVSASNRIAANQQTMAEWRLGAPLPRVGGPLRAQLLEEFVKVLGVLDVEEQPLLLVLDTFERVQARSKIELEQVWDMLEHLQERHPLLRVVISGRIEYGAMVDDSEAERRAAQERFVIERMPLDGLGRRDSETYLSVAGLPSKAAKRVADHVVDPDDGASPLTLRVAAAVWTKQRERAGTAQEPDDQFWAELKSGRIQAQLISRYLDEVVDDDVRRLAAPAFVLRRLTPELVLEVVAGPTGIDVPDRARAEHLIDVLRRETSMLTSAYGDARELLPRPEVRAQIMALLRDLDGDLLEQIHERAVAYYARRADELGLDDEAGVEARADEVFHRLASGQGEADIRARWDDRLVGRLDEAALDLGAVERALLATLSHREISSSLSAEVSQRTWENDATRRVSELVALGRFDDALKVLRERQQRSAGSELYLLETQVVLALGRLEQARETVWRGVRSFEAGGNTGGLIDLLTTAVAVHLALDDQAGAEELLGRAITLARDRHDDLRLLRVQLLALELPDRAAAGAAVIPDLVASIDDSVLRQNLPVLTAAAAAVGRDRPAVVTRAVRLGALDGLTDAENRRLARALGTFDADASLAADQEPGMVARDVRLEFDRSVTGTWLHLLRDMPTLVPDLVATALQRFDVHADPVLDEIATILSADVTSEPDEEGLGLTLGEAPAPVRLSRQQANRLIKAIVAEFDRRTFTLMLADLDIRIEAIARLEQSHEAIVLEVIATLEREGRISELIRAALAARPANIGLLSLADELGLTTVRIDIDGDQGSSFTASGEFDQSALAGRLGVMQHQVGAVYVRGTLSGTGFLVGPNLLLTSSARLAPVIDGALSPNDVVVTFGGISSGVSCALEADWMLDGGTASTSGETPLGHAIVRLAGYPGDEPVDSIGSGASSARRGFVDLTPSADKRIGPLSSGVLVLHVERSDKEGLRLVVSGGDRGSDPTNNFIVWVGSEISAGVSGAPVLDDQLDVIGVVVAASGTGRLIVTTTTAILERLERVGLGGLVGRDLS